MLLPQQLRAIWSGLFYSHSRLCIQLFGHEPVCPFLGQARYQPGADGLVHYLVAYLIKLLNRTNSRPNKTGS